MQELKQSDLNFLSTVFTTLYSCLFARSEDKYEIHVLRDNIATKFRFGSHHNNIATGMYLEYSYEIIALHAIHHRVDLIFNYNCSPTDDFTDVDALFGSIQCGLFNKLKDRGLTFYENKKCSLVIKIMMDNIEALLVELLDILPITLVKSCKNILFLPVSDKIQVITDANASGSPLISTGDQKIRDKILLQVRT